MSNKEKVSELLVHYLHTIPEQGDADEVAEIVELIYQDIQDSKRFAERRFFELDTYTSTQMNILLCLIVTIGLALVGVILVLLFAFAPS